MESELYQFIEESFPEDVLEFFSNDLEDIDGSLEEQLMALLQAEGQSIGFSVPQVAEEYISASFLPGSGPFSALEALLKQDYPEHSAEHESSGFSSPSTDFCVDANINHVFDDDQNQLVDCMGSVHSSPLSVNSMTEFSSNQDEDPLNLENVKYNFPKMFTWEEYHNEMILKDDFSDISPLKNSHSKKFVPKDTGKKIAKKEKLRNVKRASSKLKAKQEQNRQAASRYRHKKKEEEVSIQAEYEDLLERNKLLKKKALDREQEVVVLRRLLREML